MIQLDPFDWKVLQYGDSTQRAAYAVIAETGIFEVLKDYTPAHIGTIGNRLYSPASDIDVACCSDELDKVEALLVSTYGATYPVNYYQSKRAGKDYLVVQIATRIPIEVYCEDTPTELQAGYRHYAITVKLLQMLGESFRETVTRNRALNMKTEPSVVKALGIVTDNPYLELLRISDLSDSALTEIVQRVRSEG
jgi:hypothetical protein